VKLPVVDKQDIRFNRLSVGGEPFNKRVLAIAQDNHGFVWLGTDDGLYRYDGYSLRAYQHDPNNPRSLSDNTVMTIYKDRAGILWIGTLYGGLDRFDPDQDVFTQYRHDPNDPRSLRSDHVFSIYQDRAEALWIGTDDWLDRFDETSETFIHYPSPAEGDARSIADHNGLYEDHEGNLLVGSRRGLFKLEKSSGRLSHFSQSPIASDILDQQQVQSIARDHSGAVWLVLEYVNMLVALDTKTGELQRYALGSPTRVHEDRNGALSIGTVRDGLLKLDKERKHLTRYTPWPEGSGPYHIWDFLEDSEGNLWVAGESGVSRFQTAPPQFVN
jgi:ligand-binding sensor domain-containing protein